MRSVLLVGLGGALGTMLRYGVTVFTHRFWSGGFPLATFLINISGCLLIGVLFGLAQRQGWTKGDLWLLLATGFCGGFTTFSAFALENVNLLGKGNQATALFYTLLSVIFGIILCRVGIWVTGGYQ